MSNPKVSYSLDWAPGATSQVDLFNKNASGGGDEFQLKFTPPLRATTRPPVSEVFFTDDQLRKIDDFLRKFADHLRKAEDLKTAVAKDTKPRDEAIKNEVNQEIEDLFREAEAVLVDLGQTLFEDLLPRDVLVELQSRSNLFLELGIDEKLLSYPWEIMHDGDGYYCLKHRLGRFINSAKFRAPSAAEKPWGMKPEPLSVLLISVPETTFEPHRHPKLEQAKIEAEVIERILTAEVSGIHFKALAGPEASYDNVRKALMNIGTGRPQVKYQIVHFCGHADFDESNPRNSSLILHNARLQTHMLARWLTSISPIICFINACDSARTGSAAVDDMTQGGERFSIHGLGRALLESGAYVLGNRWKVSDNVAKHFATEFYTKFVSCCEPIGEAIRAGRERCRTAEAGDYGWASYIFYGDPRIRLVRHEQAGSDAGTSA